MRQLFTTLVTEHKDQEQSLRKEKLKHETNVEGLLNRYDDEMTKKQVNSPTKCCLFFKGLIFKLNLT